MALAFEKSIALAAEEVAAMKSRIIGVVLGLVDLGVLSARQSVWINVDLYIRQYTRTFCVVSTGTVPAKYRQVELVTVADVEHRRPKDIASRLLAHDRCKFRVLRKLSSHFPGTVGPLVHQHRNTAVEWLFT